MKPPGDLDRFAEWAERLPAEALLSELEAIEERIERATEEGRRWRDEIRQCWMKMRVLERAKTTHEDPTPERLAALALWAECVFQDAAGCDGAAVVERELTFDDRIGPVGKAFLELTLNEPPLSGFARGLLAALDERTPTKAAALAHRKGCGERFVHHHLRLLIKMRLAESRRGPGGGFLRTPEGTDRAE